ncbi:hypothetical protein Tco_0292128 [Tanacetum coccineum]
METEVESMVTVPIQQVSSSVPLLILQSSISHLLNQYLLPVKNHSLQLSPPTSALQQSSSVLEMVKSRLLFLQQYMFHHQEPIDQLFTILQPPSIDLDEHILLVLHQTIRNFNLKSLFKVLMKNSWTSHMGPMPQFLASWSRQFRPVLHEMTSDQIRSDLTPNRQETSIDNISSDLVSNKQKAIFLLEFLFNHFFEEYFSPINVHAEENNNDQAANASLLHKMNFINLFLLHRYKTLLSLPHAILIMKICIHFNQQSHEYQWTKDHPLEQVIDNPTNPVQTRQQLATDPEMCMFALIVSTEEPKNSKEAMADSAWIEAMQDELH